MLFDFSGPQDQLAYKLMTSTITPRPIAWVTSQNVAGVVNAAPFSFFNAMGSAPPTLALGLSRDPERGLKDTARNILESGEFVVNLVSEALAEAMNATSAAVTPDVSEMALAGLDAAASTHVSPPRIAASPVSFECVTHTAIETGPQQTLIVGRVLAIHVADEFVLDAENAYIDTPTMQLIGRMHGAGWYARTSDLFKLDRPAGRAGA